VKRAVSWLLARKENPMEELLKEALELFGEICDEKNTNSPEWIWKGKVEYFLAESQPTDLVYWRCGKCGCANHKDLSECGDCNALRR
jgi:hypothetical protein